MFKNYFKTAWRHLQKSKLYAIVNIIGLAVGLMSCILIGIYIMHELSFDKFHKNAERIVRVTMDYNFGDQTNRTASTGTKLGPQFKRTFPQVDAYVRTLKFPRVVASEDKIFDEKNFFYADAAFFEMFSFPLISGDPKTALDGPNKIVLTESSAKKYFDNDNPVNKTIKVGDKIFVVTGVTKNVSDNSQIKFDMVGSFLSLNAANRPETWWEANYNTYLLLHDGSQINSFQKQVYAYMKDVSKNELKAQPNQYLTYHLEPLTKVHLYSSLDGFEPNNNILYIYVLAGMAVLLLLIACVNYTNLSTAQSANRATEVGMRKVLGAGKKQLFSQFITESFLLTIFAVVIATGLAALMLPYFNKLSGKQLQLASLVQPSTVIGLLLLIVLVSFTAGAYPAIILSSGRIIKVLKTGFNFTGSNSLRKSLIVFQFVISIFLIVATVIILQQLSFIHRTDLGYNKDQIVVMPVDSKIKDHYEDLKKALANNPGVLSVSGAYEAPTHIGWGDGISKGEGGEGQSVTVNAIPVDEDFVKTFQLRIIAGSDYTLADVQAIDTSNNGKNFRYSFMLNQSAAKALGWKPEEAIGKTISKGASGIVKAVVKDFHFRSFHEAINPLVIFLDKTQVGEMFVKVSDKNISGTLAALEKTWKQRITHRPFEYHFLDEDYDALYKSEQRTAGVFSVFASVAIILACLGLFALTAFSMVQRTKEIGIRKILGATIPNILTLVSKDFIRLVFVAFVIATPITWFAANKWLGNFVYRIPVQWWIFLVAGVAVLVISFLTISMQAIRTALANPVKNLRTE